MLSVLIVNWNTNAKLQKCLETLFLHPPVHDLEVIVVDNNSSDGSAEMVAQHFPRVKLIQPGANTGYAAGNNIAFSAAKGDFLLTLNPDVEFTDDSIDKALKALTENPTIGCVGIRLLDPSDESTQNSVRGFPTGLGVLGQLTGLDKMFPNSALGSYSLRNFDYRRTQEAPQPMGTFLMFKRSALEQVGDPKKPFDEDFPIFFNEVDLLYRLLCKGISCLYLATASILHWHGSSTKQVRPNMIWESHRSLVRYFKKHWKGAKRLTLPFIALAAYTAAAIRAKGFHGGFRAEHHNL